MRRVVLRPDLPSVRIDGQPTKREPKASARPHVLPRVTLESEHPIRHQFFFVNNPERLVVDLEGVELDDELKALPAKVGANDPYIQSVRVGVNRPNVVRVVFDLKTEVKPSA